MPPFFGRSKSVVTTSAELAAIEANNNAVPTIRKSKSFKRIRGLLKVGESRRERRARKEAERLGNTTGASTTASATTTGATFSDQTTPISTNRTGVSSVMDTSFISTATSNLPDIDDVSTINYYNVDVDDRSVITQSTVGNNLFGNEETKLGRETGAMSTYSILKVVLLLMDPETRRFELLQLEFDSLKAYVSDVLAQIPISVTEDALRKQSYTGIAGNDGIEMEPNKLLATFCKGNEVLVAIPNGVPASECTRLARPILSDVNVVEMLQSSGIDPTGWKEDPTLKKATKKKSALKNQTNGSSSTSRDVEPDIALQAEPLDGKTSNSGGSSVLSTIIIAIFIALILQVFHIYISAPINLGSTISPGIWLSKCGLLSVVPTYCTDNAYVHFHRNGTTSYYNADKVLVWTMDGAVCPEIDEKDTSTKGAKVAVNNCIRGMHVQTDGKVFIGGKHITHVMYYNNKNIVPLTPWPFVDAPKVKVWKK